MKLIKRSTRSRAQGRRGTATQWFRSSALDPSFHLDDHALRAERGRPRWTSEVGCGALALKGTRPYSARTRLTKQSGVRCGAARIAMLLKRFLGREKGGTLHVHSGEYLIHWLLDCMLEALR
jgi:hypothetical protein